MVHEQVMVKVNAQVDRGVASLVEALNKMPDLVTAESCEGDAAREAYVSFHVCSGWKDLADHVHALSSELGKNQDVADLRFSLSIEWYAGGESPLAYLRVPRQHVSVIAKAIALAAETEQRDHERP